VVELILFFEVFMFTTEIATVVTMMENLPESTQKQVVNHLREYLADLEDEAQWDVNFAHSEPALVAAAKRARQQKQAAKSEPMNFDRL
jgi:hypothetical protein